MQRIIWESITFLCGCLYRYLVWFLHYVLQLLHYVVGFIHYEM